MNNYGTQTWSHKFFPGIRALITAGVPGMTADRVFRSNYDAQVHLDNPPADRFITAFMPSFPVDTRAVDGGGKYTTPFNATLELTAFVRLEADIEVRSTKAMEDEANGTDVFLQQLVSTVHMWPGEVVDGLYYFRRPMRLRPEGIRVERARRGHNNTRWTVATVFLEVSFVGDLGSPYPVPAP